MRAGGWAPRVAGVGGVPGVAIGLADSDVPDMGVVLPHVGRVRRGFTLAEALIASAVLAVIVIAVAASVSTSQKLAWESRKRMLATFAADGLLSELMTLDYYDIRSRDGQEEAIGSLETIDGVAYPEAYWALGRSLTVEDTTVVEGGSAIAIAGIEVRVAVFDEQRELSVLTAFVAEPVE